MTRIRIHLRIVEASNAHVLYTVICRGTKCPKSVLHPPTLLEPVYRPRREDGLVGQRRGSNRRLCVDLIFVNTAACFGTKAHYFDSVAAHSLL